MISIVEVIFKEMSLQQIPNQKRPEVDQKIGPVKGANTLLKSIIRQAFYQRYFIPRFAAQG